MQYNGSHGTGNEHDDISDFLVARMEAWINHLSRKIPHCRCSDFIFIMSYSILQLRES